MKVVSGGQTGVDRAALDVALALGLPCGGYCPRGRRAEDGPLDPRYPLVETPGDDYAERTEWNVRAADATLALTSGPMDPGTRLTVELASREGRPLLIVDLGRPDAEGAVLRWLAVVRPPTLNVAGPRESSAPGIYARAAALLRRVLATHAPAG